MYEKKKGQVVIEFLLLLGMSFFIVVALLASVLSVSESNTKVKSYDDLNDLGLSLQEEFLLAAQLEDGYIRKINLPQTANGKTYTVYLGQNNNSGSYLKITYESLELFYSLPKVYGNISIGDNLLRKYNDTLTIGP